MVAWTRDYEIIVNSEGEVGLLIEDDSLLESVRGARLEAEGLVLERDEDELGFELLSPAARSALILAGELSLILGREPLQQRSVAVQ